MRNPYVLVGIFAIQGAKQVFGDNAADSQIHNTAELSGYFRHDNLSYKACENALISPFYS